jgi:hypothetical protein
MHSDRPSIVSAYASFLNALEGADARTVMLKMTAAGQMLGVSDAEREAALGLVNTFGSAPAPVKNAPPKRGLKRKAVDPRPPGSKFLGKYVRVWWDAPYNAFFIGHVVDYTPGIGYRVVYNEGTPEEENAQEDLEAMTPLSCRVVQIPKNASKPLGAYQQPMKRLMTTPAVPVEDTLEHLEYRIDQARSLEEINLMANELDARTAKLKAMLEALGPESDDDDDNDDDKEKDDDAGAGAGGDDVVALLATKEAAELGLDLNETLCEAVPLAHASPETGAHTPRDMAIVPTLLQMATPMQPPHETPTSARALAVIEGEDDASAPNAAFVTERVAEVSEPAAHSDDAPALARDDAPIELVLEAAPEALSV